LPVRMGTNTCSSVSCSVGETRAEVGQMSRLQRVELSYRFGPLGHGFVAPTARRGHGAPLTTKTFCLRTYHLCLSEQNRTESSHCICKTYTVGQSYLRATEALELPIAFVPITPPCYRGIRITYLPTYLYRTIIPAHHQRSRNHATTQCRNTYP
jgi:hypothetical protein